LKPSDEQRAAAREFFQTYCPEHTEGDVEALARLFAKRERDAEAKAAKFGLRIAGLDSRN
jgi:hypothetical protein